MLQSGTGLKRRKLFRKSKPFIREFKPEDMWILWAAYKEGSFPLMDEMSKEDFYSRIRIRLGCYHSLMLVEDECRKFNDKRGPVCIIGANTDGWKVEPHVEFFKWASKQNILRVNVQFFNWIRQNREIGVCIVRSLKNTSNLFHHVRRYGVLTFVGKIPGGDRRGDEYCFSIRGKKPNGSIQTTEGLQRERTSGPTASSGDSGSSGGTGEEILRV